MLKSKVLPLGRLLSTNTNTPVVWRRRDFVIRAGNKASSEYISSTTNAFVKHCVKLRESTRYRYEQGTLLLVGSTLIGEAAEGRALHARVLITRQDRPDQQAADWQDSAPAAGRLSISTDRRVGVSEAALKRITGLESVDSVEVAVEVAAPSYQDLLREGAPRVVRLLALEGVQDPGNMGTLLRTAAAFGWEGVHLLRGCCDPFNDKALRASRGAAFKVPISRGGWQQLEQVAATHDLRLMAAQPAGCSSGSSSVVGGGSSRDGSSSGRQRADGGPTRQGRSQRPPPGPPGVCLVLGSEGQGLSAEALSRCSPLSIPMAPGMESLNVGAAGAILMFLLSARAPELLQQLPQLAPDAPGRL